MKKTFRLAIGVSSLFLLSSCTVDYGYTKTTTIFENRFELWSPKDKEFNANLKKSYFTLSYKGEFYYRLAFNDGTIVEDSGTYVYENNIISFLKDDEIIRKTVFRNYYEVNEQYIKDGVEFTLLWHAMNIFG